MRSSVSSVRSQWRGSSSGPSRGIDDRGQHLARYRVRDDLFAAALKARQEVNEAAAVDGASPWQMVQRMTLPLIKHAIKLYMLLTTIGTVTVFGLIYFLTRGGPGGQTTTLAIFIYERAFQFFEIGLGSAASVLSPAGCGARCRARAVPPAQGAAVTSR